MQSGFAFLIFVLLANLWIFKIGTQNPIVSLLVPGTTIAFYFWMSKRNKIVSVSFAILFLLTCFFQWQTTKPIALAYRDNDAQRVQVMRLKEYPPMYVSLFTRTKWIPLGFWLDGRNELLVFNRLLNNFYENVDINLYFFANHPRERGGNEFEKYPYTLLPFFIVGTYILTSKKATATKLSVFLLPLLLLTIIGNNNKLGPFVFFPLVTVSIANGLSSTFLFLSKLRAQYRYTMILLLCLIFIITLTQVVIYANY